ncbi:hypothetical protein ACKWTF_002120 [Chironomus riparius]
MGQTFNSCILILLFISTLAYSQEFERRNSQNNLNNGLKNIPLIGGNIQRNLDPLVTNHANNMNHMFTEQNDPMQNNVQENFQNEMKTNHKETLEDDAKLLIDKIEQLVIQYQKLKQVQDDLQNKIKQLEKIISSIKESKSKESKTIEKSTNVHQETITSMKQNNALNNNSNQPIEKNGNKIFSPNSLNWVENNKPSLNDANLRDQLDYRNSIQNLNRFTQNNRRSNLLLHPINEVGNFLNGQQIIPQNPFNDIYNSQNFAQTQNIARAGLQQLPYYGTRFYETQIPNPLQYKTYVYRK